MPRYVVNPNLPRFAGIRHDGVVYPRGAVVEMTKKQKDKYGKLDGVPRLISGTVSESPDLSDNDGTDTEGES
jgi:hypothetical protein